MSKTSARNTGGKYSRIIMRSVKCPGCGALCADYRSLRDHESDCEKYEERSELLQSRIAFMDVRVL